MGADKEQLARDFVLKGSSVPLWRLDAEQVPYKGEAVIAIGAFDGYHRGHAELLAHAVDDASVRGIPSYAVTFDPDPDCVVGGAPAKRLTSLPDRLRLLASSGVDGVIVVPFTPELASLDHVSFFEHVLARIVAVRSVHVGRDFRLGAHAAATVDVMRAWGVRHGIDVVGHDLVLMHGRAISATQIRADLSGGAIDEAALKLGRHYMLRGQVVGGRGEGKSLGFPTANLEVSGAMQAPADGVYAGYFLVGDTAWPAAVNVGLPPMFADKPHAARLEANLLGFSGDLYGCEASLSFFERLRPSVVFDSTEQLIASVLNDIDYVRVTYGGEGVDLHDFR